MRGATASDDVVGSLPPDHVRVAAGVIADGLRWLCIAAAILILGGISLASLFGYRIMVVTSGSMLPQFGPEDALLVRTVDAGAIAVGDIVTFRTAGDKGLTTHRVIEIRGAGEQTLFQTKGDANATPDVSLRPASAVYGKPIRTIAGMGGFFYWAVSPWGKLAMLGFPISYLMVHEARFLLAHRRRRQDLASVPTEGAPAEQSDLLVDLTSDLEGRVVRDSAEMEALRARLAETEAELARQATRIAAIESALAVRAGGGLQAASGRPDPRRHAGPKALPRSGDQPREALALA
ncbi:MAG: signal peptidase I [Actinomycetota bacterium]